MPIETTVLLSKLRTAGYSLFSGVPCSNFADLFDEAAREPGFLAIPAANEGSAVALAAGAVLSGRRAVVALQNSGFGNIINPLTSLLLVSELPVLLLLSVRGHPDGPADEPQHTIMGAKTTALLDLLSIGWRDFDGTDSGVDHALARSDELFCKGAPFALLFRSGQLSSCDPAKCPPNAIDYSLTVGEVIGSICGQIDPDTLVISTTGFVSRELFRVSDRPLNFYVQGALGHCGAIAAGLALTSPARTVLALDGDGSVLMHMGALSTIGYESPSNLIHVVLDNECDVSTGGQLSTSRTSSLEAVASACGYRTATLCKGSDHLIAVTEQSLRTSGPHFIVCKVNRQHPPRLPRVTSRYSPLQNKTAFQRALHNGGSEPAPAQ
ncbi:phosphonopyruvate decarboxylase [Bradyrhizobium sp. SBR1B]|uniref:phosphonopyruvate decarboxylase n=1 Tax=Bradyrhizobium sp. SBR1B TaxID=2663836 RepID=UPI00160636B5|nr:phosphonopyruvate decarboxylase [Bradyrhizobium sp. SBR1B]MBB4376353.1 phosphonopyruvate decarboxylase [Bradyrhizobium sp. SBR1B]